MTHEETEEVRSLLERHQNRIMLDLAGTELLAVLVKNSVLTQSEEDLIFKKAPTSSSLSSSAPSSVVMNKRRLTAMTSNGSGSGSSGVGVGGVGNADYSSSLAGSSANNSRSASVNGDVIITQSDNRSITPSIGGGGGNGGLDIEKSDYIGKTIVDVDVDDESNLNSINDADVLRMQCSNLIEIIAKSGFQKFKQFCYAIESECPQLIEDLINDRLKCDTTTINSNEEKIQKEIETIDYIDKEKENDRNRRAVSYGGGLTPNSNITNTTSLPRAAPRRMGMKEPPPPPPPKPALSQKSSTASIHSTATSSTTATLPKSKANSSIKSASTTSTASPILSKYPQSEYNLIQKIDSNSTLTAPAQYQAQNFYANASTISTISSKTTPAATAAATSAAGSNYSSLLCHNSSAASPLAVRKRDKLLHRFSDAATLGRKLKKKKNTNRACRSMTDTIEFLADPVIEDEFFGDRTTWEYHTVAVTRVPGYGFGIAVSGGRDNPHFANGDPSIAVSDVLKGGPAEDRLQVNDRIISVNGVSLENVEYATAVQVLRDSGNTVTLVVKRRVPLNVATMNTQAQHQHSHSMNSIGLNTQHNGNNGGLPSQVTNIVGGVGGIGSGPNINVGMTSLSQPNSLNSSMIQTTPGQPIKVTLSKGSKKDDYGIVLGCRLFIKEISAKTRDQLTANGYSMQEGDIITRIHNTNCGDTMSLKEAKKIIDGCKERLNLVVLRDITNQAATAAISNQLNNSTTQQYASHQAQVSSCSNNLDDPYLTGGTSYSSQNLYVQPPTRSTSNGPQTNGLHDEKSNLTPRGRSRGPIMDGVSLSQLDRPASPPNGGAARRADEPPRPPPPRNGSAPQNGEDFYSSRRQLYEDDTLTRVRQSSEPRFISFQKEGSVGIRLTGGNEAGIFVTAVQPGSPASLQGLTPGDKILKVNDMDMHGVTREEAVLFLLSLQDRIDLIVQYCKEDYDEVVTNQRGDSFHIKTHFHCDNPSKGEMAFKAGDVFRVIDTLHNGVVGSWQVLKIGRGHQEMQRGVIPNKSRAEELATAQFNATKKEMNANESRGNFFRRRRSTHRRSKSLNRENWDDVVFSDSISKFPAYERVVLRHPGFVRPVVLFGPVSDLAREKLAKDYPDKYSTPLQDDDKTNSSKCRIVRLSNIRDLMERGKHALLDITPNAVDRLNYAQFYPIVIFLKTDSKHVIKQLRHGLPKSAHKSSKKLLEQCQKLERVWSHIFSTQIVLNDEEVWYRKLREAIDLQQSGAVWMSESKMPDSPIEMIFPPYIAQPCNLPCCRPLLSSSVPRFVSSNSNSSSCNDRRSNSLSLNQNERSLTPPPRLRQAANQASTTTTNLSYERVYNLMQITPATKNSRIMMSIETPTAMQKPRLKSYTMVPIIKPASSMPNGLASIKPNINTPAQMQYLSNGGIDAAIASGGGVGGSSMHNNIALAAAATNNINDSDIAFADESTSTSQYHGSQPNLLSSFRNLSAACASLNKQDSLSTNNVNVKAITTTTTSAEIPTTTQSGVATTTPLTYSNYVERQSLSNKMFGQRLPSSIEKRTTPYYYHELLQKTVFDSNLNLLNNGNGNANSNNPKNNNNNNTQLMMMSPSSSNSCGFVDNISNQQIKPTQHQQQQQQQQQRLYSSSSKLTASASYLNETGGGGCGVINDIDSNGNACSHLQYIGLPAAPPPATPSTNAPTSTDMLNANHNVNGIGSSSFVVDESGGFNPIPAARHHLTNSTHIISNHSSNKFHNSNNNSVATNHSSINNVGFNKECLA